MGYSEDSKIYFGRGEVSPRPRLELFSEFVFGIQDFDEWLVGGEPDPVCVVIGELQVLFAVSDSPVGVEYVDRVVVFPEFPVQLVSPPFDPLLYYMR